MSTRLKEILKKERVSYPDKERLFLVLGLLLSGKISMGKAADLLEIRIDDLWKILDELNIKYSIYNEKEVEEEVESFKRIFKGSI